MLHPYSLLWHYLWVGPHILQAVLAVVLWRRDFHKQFPVFFAYLVFEASETFTLYGIFRLGSLRALWLVFCVALVIEGFIRLGVMGELFVHLLRSRPTVAKVGSRLISGAGALLVLLATFAAARAPVDTHQLAIAYRAHILQQTLYMVECGLLLFLFVLAACFRLAWDRATLGIGLGRGISSSVHLATWAVMANGGLTDKRYLLDFLNMATYHFCVLLWFYFLLVPQKLATTSTVALPENNLDIWNRELERLLQR